MDIVSISREPKKINDLQNIVNELLATKAADWGVLPQAVTDLAKNQKDFKPLYDNCANKVTASKGNTVLRDTYITKTYYLQLEKMFTKYLLNNDAISADDKLAMGIHSQAHTNAPIPDPTTTPIMLISNGEPLQMIVGMRNKDTGRIGKPKGVGFCELSYKIDIPAPTSIDEATKKINIKKSGTVITFNLSDKGKNIYFFARWVSKNGGTGPYTDMFGCFIV